MPILFGLAPSSTVQVIDVPNDKNSHGECHEKSIENVQENLVGDEIAGISLQILNDPKNTTHKDDCARDVEDV